MEERRSNLINLITNWYAAFHSGKVIKGDNVYKNLIIVPVQASREAIPATVPAATAASEPPRRSVRIKVKGSGLPKRSKSIIGKGLPHKYGSPFSGQVFSHFKIT